GGQRVGGRIGFSAVPLGLRFDPANLHGFATGGGGAVVRVQLLEEKLPESMKQIEEALAAPVLYPSEVRMPAGGPEFDPARLPPLRPDAGTLVVGRMKAAKEFTCTVKGAVPGHDGPVSQEVTEAVREPELDNFFLVSMAAQWSKARDQQALIRA